MFRIRLFFPDPDQPCFSESGSAKNPDPIRKNPDPWKKRPKTGVKVKKKYYISYLAHCPFGQAPPKPCQNYHLDPISLFMDGSLLLKPGSGLAKKPGSIRIRIRNTAKKAVAPQRCTMFLRPPGQIPATGPAGRVDGRWILEGNQIKHSVRIFRAYWSRWPNSKIEVIK